MGNTNTEKQLDIIFEAMKLMSAAQRDMGEITFEQALEIIKIQRFDTFKERSEVLNALERIEKRVIGE